MSAWHERIQIDGSRVDPDITDAIPQGGAILTRSMEGAEQLELTVLDLVGPGREPLEFFRNGGLSRKGKTNSRQQALRLAAWERVGSMRLNFDGVWFRLAGWHANYDEGSPHSTTLTFESELATLMRNRDRPFRASRGAYTRGGFIRILGLHSQMRDLSDRGIVTFAIYTPDPDRKEDVAKVRDVERRKGLNPSKSLTVKGFRMDDEQRRVATVALEEADRQNASERVMLALLVALIQESDIRNLTHGHSTSVGPLQLLDIHLGGSASTTGGRRDVKLVVRLFLTKGFWGKGGAIKLARENPDWSVGEIAQNVQGSKYPDRYDPHRGEAEKILDAWGGANRTFTMRERFEFRAGERDRQTGRRENYWDASGRLANDRRWRRFCSQNALWVGPDEWFFRNRPAFVVDLSKNMADQGILGFTADADVGIPASEVRLRAIAPRWTAGQAAVFEFVNAGPLTGRWLIWENRLDLTQPAEIAELVLRRPAPQKKEPAPTVRVREEGRPEAGSARDRIVAAAEEALEYVPQYRYEQSRPFPTYLIPRVPELLYIDCSAFVTLVYKKAGVKDPNGSDYAVVPGYGRYKRGHLGFTGTLVAQGRKTSDPQPGDLVFYGGGPPYGHVGVYVGNDKVIQIGSTPGPRKVKVRYRNDFAGYWTYDLSDAETRIDSSSLPGGADGR